MPKSQRAAELHFDSMQSLQTAVSGLLTVLVAEDDKAS